jgi:hypothetical protein
MRLSRVDAQRDTMMRAGSCPRRREADAGPLLEHVAPVDQPSGGPLIGGVRRPRVAGPFDPVERKELMRLRIVQHDNRDRPMVVCDHCGEAIADVWEGNCQWRYDVPGDYPGSAVYFTHKKCCLAFEKANPGEWGAMQLDFLLVYPSNGLNLNWEASRIRAELLDRIE